jgi:hypothetical protein
MAKPEIIAHPKAPMLNMISTLSRRLFLRILSLIGTALIPFNESGAEGVAMRSTEDSEIHKRGPEENEKILAQIYVAFGQGTGEIRVAREACLALRAHALPRLEAMAVNWGTEAVQILERVRVIGRAARQQAVARFDTAVKVQDVEFVVPLVTLVSATPLCIPGEDERLRQRLNPLEIFVKEQRVIVGGHQIPLPISPNHLSVELGAPTRTVNKPGAADQLLIWDNLGISAYKSGTADKIESLIFYVGLPQNQQFSPVVPVGPLTIADVRVGPSATLDSLGNDLQKAGCKSYLRLPSGVWTLTYGLFKITLEQKDSTAIETITVGAPN